VVAASFPVAVGASLAEVLSQRRLSVGECVTVGIGVAAVLSAMHGERIAHGDVSAANVLVAGRAVTVADTMGALGEELGTVAYAAPERARGATPAGDVFALGMLLRSIADDEAEPVMRAWTEPLVGQDPGGRPAAAHAAAALALCAKAQPVRDAAAPVAAAIRAGGVERTVKRREDRWWRAERMALRLSPLAVLVAVAAVTGSALVPSVAAVPTRLGADPPKVQALGTVPVAAAAFDSPEAAATKLVAQRVRALAAGDERALLALSVPGSEAGAADAETAKSLADGSLAFTGLALEGATARLIATTPGGALVEVTSALSGYSVGKERVAAGDATAVLELRLTQKGWLVARILPPA